MPNKKGIRLSRGPGTASISNEIKRLSIPVEIRMNVLAMDFIKNTPDLTFMVIGAVRKNFSVFYESVKNLIRHEFLSWEFLACLIHKPENMVFINPLC